LDYYLKYGKLPDEGGANDASKGAKYRDAQTTIRNFGDSQDAYLF